MARIVCVRTLDEQANQPDEPVSQPAKLRACMCNSFFIRHRLASRVCARRRRHHRPDRCHVVLHSDDSVFFLVARSFSLLSFVDLNEMMIICLTRITCEFGTASSGFEHEVSGAANTENRARKLCISERTNQRMKEFNFSRR